MIFSLRQLQEKCQEQRQPLYITFIDLTKAFDLAGKACGVKQGCVLAPTLFGIFFSLLLRHAFSQSEDGVFIRTRSDGNLFNLAHLRAKTKVRRVLVREMMFADDVALTAHSEEALRTSIKLSEGKREDQWKEKRQHRQQRAESVPKEVATGFTCSNCNRLCRSRIGLFSHSKYCNPTSD
ncbi:hypothetical protein QQF64_025503 [Cirrhinus molitorella]|uniref:Reverse transcriptase domain-containing protein n=1 Tax=Cirrhinus molitorella TaxID=172907 RepID=A0ABR3NQN3_9TELE